MSSRNVAAAAKASGLGVRTLHRWLDDPAFVAELKAVEGAAIDQAVRRLAELSGVAIDTLKAAMLDTELLPGARVRAADIVLSRLLSLKELADLEERITALEQAQKDGKR